MELGIRHWLSALLLAGLLHAALALWFSPPLMTVVDSGIRGFEIDLGAPDSFVATQTPIVAPETQPSKAESLVDNTTAIVSADTTEHAKLKPTVAELPSTIPESASTEANTAPTTPNEPTFETAMAHDLAPTPSKKPITQPKAKVETKPKDETKSKPVKKKTQKPKKPVKKVKPKSNPKKIAKTKPPSKAKPQKKAQKATAKKGATQKNSTQIGSQGSGKTGNQAKKTTGNNSAKTASGNPAAKRNYYAQLAAWLNKHKRYPKRARQRRQQGIVQVRFTIDRNGRVLANNIVNGSGHRLLDKEVQAMLKRASPMPPIPAELQMTKLTITVPISFKLR